MREALFYEVIDNTIECKLCPHKCKIPLDKTGFCKVRRNISNTLYTLNYGVVSAINLDPIEKKPLFHYYPGYKIFSIGTYGCNMKCMFCQNNELSDFTFNINYFEVIEKYEIEDLLRLSLSQMNRQKTKLTAFTYSEPFVWYEFVKDYAEINKKNGIKNVLVTNGLISEIPLKEISGLIDAANIDLKAFTSDKYKRLGGDLKTVQNTIEFCYKNNIHTEITMLLVTKFNDVEKEVEEAAKYLASIDKNIVFHITRYYPRHRYNEPPTSINFINDMKALSQNYLNYVYTGNCGIEESTYCPQCKTKLIERNYYDVKILSYSMSNGYLNCHHCGFKTNVKMD